MKRENGGPAGVIEREPALVDDEQGRPPVEAIANAMEEIGEHGGRGAGPDQSLDLERLHRCCAEMFGFRIEQPAIGAADAIGPQRLLQVV